MNHTLSRARRTALAALIAVPLFALAPVAAHADALDTITKSGTLRVAVPEDYPPFGSVGADMKPQGYDIDMAALLAQGDEREARTRAGQQREPHSVSARRTRSICVISSLGKTPEREKVIDFSTAYAPYFQGVFGPADIKVTAPPI